MAILGFDQFVDVNVYFFQAHSFLAYCFFISIDPSCLRVTIVDLDSSYHRVIVYFLF